MKQCELVPLSTTQSFAVVKRRALLAAFTAAILGISSAQSSAQSISGFAQLPSATFAPGPTSGQFINSANGISVPFLNQQPVQGFSGVLHDGGNNFLVLTDNGYGAKGNSADSVLRLNKVSTNFKTTAGGSGVVTYNGNIVLSDPDRLVNFPIVADQVNYPNGGNNIPVDPRIISGRLLTGADFDLESVRKAADGTYWFGDEFGPFLVHTDLNGKVLGAPVALPGVKSPSNPFLAGSTANLPGSRGFEGMGISADGKKLYPMLEGPLTTDPDQSKLVINEFDTVSKNYTGRQWFYKMEDTRAKGHHIGDLSPVGNNKFVLTETDLSDSAAGFKKIFLLDFNQVDANGFVSKTELVDLLHIADPNHLASNLDEYSMPFSTIEGLILTAPNELLVLNDNNYPFTAGRVPGTPDNNEFVKIKFSQSLAGASVPDVGNNAVLMALGMGALGMLRRRARS